MSSRNLLFIGKNARNEMCSNSKCCDKMISFCSQDVAVKFWTPKVNMLFTNQEYFMQFIENWIVEFRRFKNHSLGLIIDCHMMNSIFRNFIILLIMKSRHFNISINLICKDSTWSKHKRIYFDWTFIFQKQIQTNERLPTYDECTQQDPPSYIFE